MRPDKLRSLGIIRLEPDAEHIASWHPVVALAVARWLEAEADFADDPKNCAEPLPESVEFARAYLGEPDTREGQ